MLIASITQSKQLLSPIGLQEQPKIAATTATTKLIVTVEEHSIIGGLGSAVAEIVSEMTQKQAVLRRIGVPDTFATVVGSRPYLKKVYGLDTDSIINIILKDLQ